jgi:ankyrin repeat protein
MDQERFAGQLEALIDAIKAGDLDGVNQLLRQNPTLANGRPPNGEPPVLTALYRGRQTAIAALIAAGAEIDVFAAAALGRLDDLRNTLNVKTVNAYSHDGWTPLHLASFFGHTDAARVLLDSGADVRAVSQNSLANTPLHAATAGKHTDVALLLYARGGDRFTADAGGYTPLQIAEQNELSSVVEAMRADPR